MVTSIVLEAQSLLISSNHHPATDPNVTEPFQLLTSLDLCIVQISWCLLFFGIQIFHCLSVCIAHSTLFESSSRCDSLWSWSYTALSLLLLLRLMNKRVDLDLSNSKTLACNCWHLYLLLIALNACSSLNQSPLTSCWKPLQ